MTTKIDPDLLLPLSKFLAMLPDVKPRVAARELRDDFMEAVLANQDSFEYGKTRVTVAQANEFFVSDAWQTDHVTPGAAALLVKMYEADGLPRSVRRPPAPVPGEVHTYVASQAALEAETARRQELKEERQAKVQAPESVSEDEFDYGLLNDIFFKHRGPGSGSMLIGGIEVHKDVRTYRSNSGKSQDSAVTFRWVSPTRGPLVLQKDSVYENNRRNDAERNWGLPE